jgi:site-specific DNA recombinase
MLDAVYVDPVEAKSIVAIKPKPAFHALFEISTTRDDSEVALIKERASWRWPRGSVFVVETGESRTPRPERDAPDLLQA